MDRYRELEQLVKQFGQELLCDTKYTARLEELELIRDQKYHLHA